ncbi:hypothetical protein CPB86DRAFT_816863 [Serendipita vermifera]|nr:hypothetical protein CPB86DRAFT_816863 [Serendipita vermifera]
MEIPGLSGKFHFAFADNLGHRSPWNARTEVVPMQKLQDAVIDLLQTVGPNTNFEARMLLVPLYRSMDIKSSILSLPPDKQQEDRGRIMSINRYLMHDMCHALKAIPLAFRSKEFKEKRDERICNEADGINHCLQNAPNDTRLLPICLEENLMWHLVTTDIPEKRRNSISPPHYLVLKILESANLQYDILAMEEKQCLIAYLLSIDNFLVLNYALESRIHSLGNIFIQLYPKIVASKHDLDPGTADIIDTFGASIAELCYVPSNRLSGDFIDAVRATSTH